MNCNQLVNNAIKKLDVIILLNSNHAGVELAQKTKLNITELEKTLDILNGDILVDKDKVSGQINQFNGSVNALIGVYSDVESVEGLAAKEVFNSGEILSLEINRFYQEKESEEEKTSCSATLEDIQKIFTIITNDMDFAIGRIEQGLVDDLVTKMLTGMREDRIPNLVEILNSFVVENYDDNEKLFAENDKLSEKIAELTELVAKLKLAKDGSDHHLKTVENELTMVSQQLNAEKQLKRQATDELKELKLLNPTALKETNAKQKIELVSLRKEVKDLGRELRVKTETINYMRQEFGKLDARFSTLTEAHNAIIDSMNKVTGENLEGKLAYQSPHDDNVFAWCHIFFSQKTLYVDNKKRPKGEKIITIYPFHLQIRTNIAIGIDVDVSEFGGIKIPVVKGVTDWFGSNFLGTIQDKYDEYTKSSYPELWERIQYFRSINLRTIKGISESVCDALSKFDINNISDAGSLGASNLQAIAKITKPQAEKITAICIEYLERYITEHGDLDITTSKDAESQRQTDVMYKNNLKEAVKKLKEEVPDLLAEVRKTLPESYRELYGK